MEYLHLLSAREAARLIAQRLITAEALVRACLERIAEREGEVGAWVNLDRDYALREARKLDQGPVLGPLHGLPFGVKDVIDTAELPTEYGTPVYAGFRPAWDAACVAAARAAGGVLLGKTVTTELAYYHPGKTRNPLNLEHTPGGSSSGSAAAVADRMVPLALGTQTGGSVIRPASFCGIVGYKPSFGLIPRAGVKIQSETLDTVGVFARSVDDAALFVAALTGRDGLMQLRPFGVPIRIGVCHTQEWPHAGLETIAALEHAARLFARQGAQVSDVRLPEPFAEIGNAHQTVMEYEDARSYRHEWEAHGAQLSARLRELIQAGLACPPEKYDAAIAHTHGCRRLFDQVMADYDVLLTPAAPGEAPHGIGATGSPVFNRMWTLLGTPALTLPAGKGPSGLPVGIQLVGRCRDDARLLAAASWAERMLATHAAD